MDIDTLTLRDMVHQQQRGRLQSYQLAQHYLDRITRHNPQLNAIIEAAAPDTVLASAAQADSDGRQGHWHGPLHGIPITIKDACHLAGFHPSRGVRELHGPVSSKNATVAQRLLDAGAMPLGLTNVPEMCMAFETDNLLYGPTLNPHDHRRSAGGSSGGEASSIAAGMSPAGLASDACGSVRIPAHFNGICGLKLTQWRVPLTGQFPNDRSGLFHLTSAFGVMGRYVDDVALLGQLINGPDGHDPDTVPAPWHDYRQQPVAALRVGIWYEDTGPTAPAESTIAMLQQVQQYLSGSVASVSRLVPPLVDEACDVLWKILVLGADKGRSWQKLFTHMGKTQFSVPLSQLLALSETLELSVDEFRASFVQRDTLRYRLSALFNQLDVLICPVYPDVAFYPGESMVQPERFRYVFPFSLSGSPAVVIPAGKCPHSGLPIGVQLVGRHWDEHQILALAAHLERHLPAWAPVG